LTSAFVDIAGSPFEGETDGPAWDGTALLFSRPAANEIMRFDPVARRTERLRHSTAGNRGLAVGPDGRLYGAQSRSRRVVWYAADGRTFLLNPMLDGERQNEPQHLAVDASGRIWFSDDWSVEASGGPVGWPPLDHRSILRLSRAAETDDGIGDWTLERMTWDTLAPRGIALSPDGSTLYVTDRGAGADSGPSLRSYPITAEGLGPGRIVELTRPNGDAAGTPDGLACAEDGRLFVVVRSTAGSRSTVLTLGREGTVTGQLTLPHVQPTGCAVGGADGSTLFVTTSEGRVLQTRMGEATDQGRARAS
jgi:gluconolactonase